jgi:trimethylamine--corrinoid protein Co-methyltransferase
MDFKPELKVLNDEQVYQIHEAALQILWQTGVLVKSEDARQLLAKAGARVNNQSMICHIPAYIVEEALKRAPSSFTLFARNPKNNVHVSTRATHIEPMIGRINCYDYKSGTTHPTTLEDVGHLIKISDAMPHYHLLHSGAIMPQISGISIRTTHVHGYLQSVRNSSKVIKATSREKILAEDCLRMVAAIAGGEDEFKKKPYTFTTDNPVAPLHHDRDQMDGALLFAKYGLPIDVTSEPQAGATAPVSIAGLLAQQTADIISAITILQLANPGTPVWYGTCGSIMDMKVGRIALGAIEMGIINVASAQIAHYYNIPCRGTASATDSKLLDIQAGFEKSMSLTMAVLGGVNKIFYPGTIEGAMTVSKESLVIDNEILGQLFRVTDGVDVCKDTLALDVIHKVGPGGHFLGQKHTMQFLKKEQYIPQISPRQTRAQWDAGGSKCTAELAYEKVQSIIADYVVDPLDANVEAELIRIVEEVEIREAKKNK